MGMSQMDFQRFYFYTNLRLRIIGNSLGICTSIRNDCISSMARLCVSLRTSSALLARKPGMTSLDIIKARCNGLATQCESRKETMAI